MTFDKKITLIGVVFLIVAVAVIFNLERFTGKAAAVKTIEPKVYASANPQITEQEQCTVKAGSKVYITVETGNRGIRRTGYLYDNKGTNPLGVASIEFDQNCGGSTCRQNKITWAEYRTPTSWNGKYCIKVVEMDTKKAASKCFTVQ